VSDLYPAVTPCHDAFVLPYAAYLRVYEPLSAFSGADARHWATYAVSADRPRRAGALAAEHADALRRLISVPQVMVPAWESGDAYVRWVDGATYICPWQTRLRSWLGLSRLRTAVPLLWSAAFTPEAVQAIWRWSGGLPRVVNLLCDRALMAGAADRVNSITLAIIQDAAANLALRLPDTASARRLRASAWAAVPLAILLAAAGVLTFMPVADWIEAPRPHPPAPPPSTLMPEPATAKPIPDDVGLP